MKILHFSDTHLGFSEYNKIDPITGINQREQDFYDAWERVINAILAEKPNVVIHAGDLFHTPRPNNRALNVALNGIKRVSEAGIPFVLVAGNHETPRIRATGSIFESISLFENVYPAYQNDYSRFRIQGVDFHCIPHCSLTEEMERAFDAITLQEDAAANVLVAHGAWSGNDFYGMGEFNEQRLPDIEGLLGVKFDYIALGHYHRFVQIKEHVCYSGSTERTSLNEANTRCGYLTVDLDPMTITFQQISTRPMVRLPNLDANALTAQDVYEALTKLSTPELNDAIVHLTLDNLENHTFLKLDMRKIDEIFSQTFYLEKYFNRKSSDTDVSPSTTRIESLAVEFERYIDVLTDVELDKERLFQKGIEYLSTHH